MIRQANERDFIGNITTVSEVRIHALKHAYGVDAPFIQFFSDETGSLASIMDGVCTIHCVDKISDEWLIFLQMHADIRKIYADGENADLLKRYFVTAEAKNGEVLYIENVTSETPLQAKMPSIAALHAFLSENFNDFPLFEQWYVDVSHRVRHGCCHIAALLRDNTIVSSAMSVAETPQIALIGGVATSPAHRGEGMASQCIRDLLLMLTQPLILINPVNEYASQLYKKLGFKPYGEWVELTLP